MKVSIDLRKEFMEFMDDYGHDVLLHRTGRKLRCRCWSEKYKEADSKCPICLGVGWVGRIERHSIRHKSAVQTINRTNLSVSTEMGPMWIDADTYYMRHKANPKPGDYFYKVGWNGDKPTHLIGVYKINDVFQNRGDNGRLEYWTVSAKSQTVDQDIKDFAIRAIGPLKNYEIIHGRGRR